MDIASKEGNQPKSDLEDDMDLTNLNWLTELRNQTAISWPIRNISYTMEEDSFKNGKKEFRMSESESVKRVPNETNGGNKSLKVKACKSKTNTAPNSIESHTQNKRLSPSERFDLFISKIRRDLAMYNELSMSFQNDVTRKPPFNYSHIIGMAMLEKGRITLQQICCWIEQKFAYFRVRKKWNNSIRHNLSLHHCFRKIKRNKAEKGKGGYWELGIDLRKCDKRRIRNRKCQLIKTKYSNQKTFVSDSNISEENTVCVENNISLTSDNGTDLKTKEVLMNNTPQTLLEEDCILNHPVEIANEPLIQTQLHVGTFIITTSTTNELQQQSLSNPHSTNQLRFDDRQKNLLKFDECLECPSSEGQYKITTSNFEIDKNTRSESVSMPYEFSNIDVDLFHPYVDGIEDAFQYLRSLEACRNDDGLDNLFDISISEY